MEAKTAGNPALTREEFMTLSEAPEPKLTPQDRLALRAWATRYPMIPPFKLSAVKIAMQPVFAFWRYEWLSKRGQLVAE